MSLGIRNIGQDKYLIQSGELTPLFSSTFFKIANNLFIVSSKQAFYDVTAQASHADHLASEMETMICMHVHMP